MAGGGCEGVGVGGSTFLFACLSAIKGSKRGGGFLELVRGSGGTAVEQIGKVKASWFFGHYEGECLAALKFKSFLSSCAVSPTLSLQENSPT